MGAFFHIGSYDLELDKKLAEETTVLVESYTVSSLILLNAVFIMSQS